MGSHVESHIAFSPIVILSILLYYFNYKSHVTQPYVYTYSPGLSLRRVRSQASGKGAQTTINTKSNNPDHKKLQLSRFLFQPSSKNEQISRCGLRKNCIPGKELRNGLRNEQLFLLLAQTVVSCSENRAREGGCQGAPSHGHKDLFA